MGIEPTWLAWKARTLPLSYARNVLNHSLRAVIVNVVATGLLNGEWQIPQDQPED